MTLSLMTSMALFAFAASFSPGPVNLVSVSNGARYGPVSYTHLRAHET